MKCKRKKPEACFNCTLPECIDDSAPSFDELEAIMCVCKDDEIKHNLAVRKAKIKYRNSERGKTKEKEHNRRYYQAHREEIIARVMQRRAAQHG